VSWQDAEGAAVVAASLSEHRGKTRQSKAKQNKTKQSFADTTTAGVAL
jgi:hypothetical protein